MRPGKSAGLLPVITLTSMVLTACQADPVPRPQRTAAIPQAATGTGAQPAADPADVTVTDRAVEAGLYDGNPVRTYDSVPYDYDGDGLVDVLINPHNERGGLRLYRNEGGGRFRHVLQGQFVSRSPATGYITNDRHGCDWADVDTDGRTDLFCAMGADQGTLVGKANELWLQQPDGTFVNRGAEYGVTDPVGPGRDATFIDVDHDEYPDLYVSNHVRLDDLPSPNRLYLNVSGKKFIEAPELGLHEQLNGLPGNRSCAQAVDYDVDGWEDLLVCGNKGLRLYRNLEGRRFEDVTRRMSVAAGTWRMAMMADLNGDEVPDLVGLNGDGTQLQLQVNALGLLGKPWDVTELSAAVDLTVGDVDRDRDLDVYVAQAEQVPHVLLLNNGTATGFERRHVEGTAQGSGQSTTAFDHDGNGTADVIVMQGGEVRGPIQLLSFEPLTTKDEG